MIEARDVVVRVGGATLLRDVTFTALPGTVTGIIGPNGAGKSTLLAALAGDLPLAAGSVTIGGLAPNSSSARSLAQVRAVMLQDVNVAFSFLVRDVVSMGRRPWAGMERSADDAERVEAALELTGTAKLADRDIMTLSGGERARVALARVLAQETPVTLFDEPTAAMDIGYQERTLGIIRGLAAAGGTAVVVLHDLNAAAAYCDRFYCLRDGAVAACGGVDQVFQSSVLSEVYDWPIRVSRDGGVGGRVGGSVVVQPERAGVPPLS